MLRVLICRMCSLARLSFPAVEEVRAAVCKDPQVAMPRFAAGSVFFFENFACISYEGSIRKDRGCCSAQIHL